MCDCHVVCFCRVEAYPQVCLHYFDGGVGGLIVGVCAAWCVGLVDTPLSVTKVLLCWCTVGCLGQHWLFLLGPAYTGDLLWLFVCGVVLCENCIVDASIFLFCVLVFIPVCLCVRVFCYGRMVDALAC